MGILEKLRSQPKHKHADPTVRIEGVHEIDLSLEPDLVVSLAKDDPDARVRRAAVARVSDASVLADVARNESDASVRDHAVSQLAELAAKHDEQSASAAVNALVSLGRERELTTLAKAAGPESIRRAALAGVRDEKSLGSIARNAFEASARLLAVERLTDQAELEAVAIRGEHADAAVAAVDRLSNPSAETLSSIAQKARAKAAQKRARALAKAHEPAVVEAPAEGPSYKQIDQDKASDFVKQMEALSAVSDSTAMREAYAAARVAWVELLADADIQPEIAMRFEAASEVVRQRLDADAAARAEAERQRRAVEQEQADRASACAHVEGLSGDDILDRVAAARASWEGMPPMPEAWATQFDHRFNEACRAAEKRHERRQQAKQSAERLPSLVPEIETLVANENYADIRNQWV